MRPSTLSRAALAALAVLALATLAAAAGADPDGASPRAPERELLSVSTGPRAELVETVPVARRPSARERSVLSIGLPRVRRGDAIRFRGEVTATTTCVEPLPRCIGRPYGFDPHITARVVLAGGRDAAGRATQAVSRRVRVTCEQTRPNRNHHCPLVVEGRIEIRDIARLPCHASACRLNVLMGAGHRNRRGGEVVVVGADRPDGSVEPGKARLAAAISRDRARLEVASRDTGRLRAKRLPASGAARVVLSQRLPELRDGDVLLADARVRTRIGQLPYFVAAKVILSRRRAAARPGKLARRSVTRAGTMTETNGFNCTPGPSAFQSPCTTRKVGIAELKHTPGPAKRPTALYANVVVRSFPKRAQARGAYPPARVLRPSKLRVVRLRER